jgi:hypothetical protein
MEYQVPSKSHYWMVNLTKSGVPLSIEWGKASKALGVLEKKWKYEKVNPFLLMVHHVGPLFS